MLPHDFYITRIRGQQRTRTLVVFMQTEMWQTINGETLLVLLEQVADTLPQAASTVHEESPKNCPISGVHFTL